MQMKTCLKIIFHNTSKNEACNSEKNNMLHCMNMYQLEEVFLPFHWESRMAMMMTAKPAIMRRVMRSW